MIHGSSRARRLLPVSLVLTLCAISSGTGISSGQLPDPVATFSILGFDSATGEVGGAVQSRVFSVGNGVLWGEADVGLAATQAIVDVSYGPRAIQLLRAGLRPDAFRGWRCEMSYPVPLIEMQVAFTFAGHSGN